MIFGLFCSSVFMSCSASVVGIILCFGEEATDCCLIGTEPAAFNEASVGVYSKKLLDNHSCQQARFSRQFYDAMTLSLTTSGHISILLGNSRCRIALWNFTGRASASPMCIAPSLSTCVERAVGIRLQTATHYLYRWNAPFALYLVF